MSRLGASTAPVTVFTDGPLGPGSLQVWVEAEDEATGALIDLVPSSGGAQDGWFGACRGWTPTTGR